jgi:mycothiol system anti-sigma-R factor
MAEDKGDCVEAVHLLYHYLDGELTTERRVLIKQHLDDCPPCGQAFDFEAELRVVISQKCREQVPDGLRQRVADALRQARGPLE